MGQSTVLRTTQSYQTGTVSVTSQVTIVNCLSFPHPVPPSTGGVGSGVSAGED